MTLESRRCAEVQSELEAYVLGELETASEDRLASHLLACSSCAADAGVAERVAVELQALPVFDAPEKLIERIKKTAREQGATVVSIDARRGRRVLWPAALAATLVAALAVGWWQSEGPLDGPTPVEIAQAEEEARYALALLARLGRKASAELRQEVLIERVALPVLDGVGRSLDRGGWATATAKTDGGLES